MSNQNPLLQNVASPEDCRLKVTCIGNLADPISRRGRDKYRIFNGVKGEYGVYIFLDESKIPLYVGEATGQTLETRIRQNYTENSGGTFRDNYGGKKTDAGKKDIKANLRCFKDALRNKQWSIITISVRRQDKRRWIHVLEKVLIGFLEPKYNKE